MDGVGRVIFSSKLVKENVANAQNLKQIRFYFFDFNFEKAYEFIYFVFFECFFSKHGFAFVFLGVCSGNDRNCIFEWLVVTFELKNTLMELCLKYKML